LRLAGSLALEVPLVLAALALRAGQGAGQRLCRARRKARRGGRQRLL